MPVEVPTKYAEIIVKNDSKVTGSFSLKEGISVLIYKDNKTTTILWINLVSIKNNGKIKFVSIILIFFF